MYSGLTGAVEGGRRSDLGLGTGLGAAEGISRCDTLGVGLQEVGAEGGSLQWLMMVEFVFETSFKYTEVRGLARRGVSPKNIRTSQL